MTSTKYNISLEKIKAYLKGDGWRIVNDSSRWCVFVGHEDVNGDLFEIVLPQKDGSPEYPIYVMHTIEILSSLADKSRELIIQEIQSVNRDVMLVREVNSNGGTSIPIESAAKQIPNLKQLVAYAACSEKNQKTHYRDSTQGKDMAKHFRFGHTSNGSFGYRVESSVGEKTQFQENTRQLRQLQIFEEQEIEVIPPLERRVMERIVRGLAATAETVQIGDLDPLLKGYAAGFNANMCYALLKVSEGHNEPIEFNVTWSKKIPVSKDVTQHCNIRIDRSHLGFLKTASQQLKKIEPIQTSIEGLVTALSSEDDPRGDDVEERAVIIRVATGKHKSRKMRIALGKRDYEQAHRAHIDWKTISVTGVMQYIGSHWYLSDPQDFQIIR